MGNSAGRVGAGNEGQTDQGRGNKVAFSFTKGGRKTGRVGGGKSMPANPNTVDGNVRKSSPDPRTK